jgi:Iap family predicted aminopeptidase
LLSNPSRRRVDGDGASATSYCNFNNIGGRTIILSGAPYLMKHLIFFHKQGLTPPRHPKFHPKVCFGLPRTPLAALQAPQFQVNRPGFAGGLLI